MCLNKILCQISENLPGLDFIAPYGKLICINHIMYQPYLNVIPVKSHRIALTRLITSSHHLKIETGRWARPVTPQSERICPFCPGKQEDEFHLLLECSSYQDIRQRYIPRYYLRRPSMLKAIQLINTTSKKLINALSKFVF